MNEQSTQPTADLFSNTSSSPLFITTSTSGTPKLPKLRHGVFSSATAHSICTGDLLLENRTSVTGCVVQGGKSLLRVDCQVLPEAVHPLQPVTPSPANNYVGNSSKSGWMVPTYHSKIEFCSEREGKRIGIDGTSKTPSLNLLKPTASSLGHRVDKVANSPALLLSIPQSHGRVDALTPPLPMISMSPKRHYNKNHYSSQCHHPHSSGCTDYETIDGGHQHVMTKRLTIDSPVFEDRPIPSTMDPFRNIRVISSPARYSASNNTSMDDEEMEHINAKNSGDEHFGLFFEDRVGHSSIHAPPSAASPSIHDLDPTTPVPNSTSGINRRSSWSPGQLVYSDDCEKNHRNLSGNDFCPQQLRSHLFDPVASQLLACQEDQDDNLFMPKNAPDSEEDDLSMEETNSRYNGIAYPSAPLSPFVMTGQDAMGRMNPSVAPLSPYPLFREVSGRLLDVKTHEDMTLLARPIPRKCPISFI